MSVPQATAILLAERPAAIFTTGGYVAVPVLLAAAPLGIPVVLWDGNVDPGPCGPRHGAAGRRARGLVRGDLPGAGRRGARPAVLRDRARRSATSRAIDRDAARLRMGIAADERVLLIFGGSQAVRRFNAAVAEALPRLVERVTVIHVTGDDGYAAALAGREGLPEPIRQRYRPYPFLRDEMLAALAAADLVVGRAGSSTLAEVTALGLPMVVVPYPHAAGHQRANAASLVDAGAARLVDDEAFDADALRRRGGAPRRPGRARRDVGGGPRARPARRGRRRRRARPGRGGAGCPFRTPGEIERRARGRAA